MKGQIESAPIQISTRNAGRGGHHGSPAGAPPTGRGWIPFGGIPLTLSLAQRQGLMTGLLLSIIIFWSVQAILKHEHQRNTPLNDILVYITLAVSILSYLYFQILIHMP